MASTMTQKAAMAGSSLTVSTPQRRSSISTTIQANKVRKIDIKKQGLNTIQNKVVRNNLMGISESMTKKDWKDSQGRKGKGFGVYRFANKYGANVDGYSPIYTPEVWSETGSEYKLGTKGLLAWAGLVTVLLGVGLNLVISTSALGS